MVFILIKIMKKLCNKYLKISFWSLTLINLILFFSFLIVSLCNKNYSFFYGFLLCFFLPYIAFFFMFIKWKIFLLKISKKKIIFLITLAKISTILFFILLPIIGIQSNIFYDDIIFNFWGMLPPIITTFFYLFTNQIFIPLFFQNKYNCSNIK